MKANVVKKMAVVLAAGALCFSLAACGSGSNSTSGDNKQSESTADGAAEQIATPFSEYDSLEEAEKAAGFEISLPEPPSDYSDVTYNVYEDEKMMEVIYANAEGGEGYRIRKMAGSDDISGDFTDYSETNSVGVNGNSVTMKGNDGEVSVATWTADSYTYAVDIDMDGQGMDADAVSALIASIN